MSSGPLAILSPNLGRDTPVRHLLDRFLGGYQGPRDWRPKRFQIRLWTADATEETQTALATRAQLGLIVSPRTSVALEGAKDILVFPDSNGEWADARLIKTALRAAPAGTRIGIYGVLANRATEAADLQNRAAGASVALRTFALPAYLPRLPQLPRPLPSPARDLLILVQGESRPALWRGLEGLAPWLETESAVISTRSWSGPAVWEAGRSAAWSESLFRAALSRSNTPQGHALEDGRTEDLWGKGLVPRLCQNPRAWQIRLESGQSVTVLAVDGVIAETNLALVTTHDEVFSCQLFEPPPSNREGYSRLAFALENWFAGGRAPSHPSMSRMTATILESFQQPRAAAPRRGLPQASI